MGFFLFFYKPKIKEIILQLNSSCLERLQICANIAPSNITDFQKQVCAGWEWVMYMTEVPNYFLPNAVHVPRIKFFTSTKICLLLLLCQNWGCIVYVKNMVVVFPFTTRKVFSILHSKKIWNYICKFFSFLCFFPNRISNRLYCTFHINFENELIFEPLYSRSWNDLIFCVGEKLH